MIEAIIFDMDGVLIDSEPLWREAEVKVFAKHGIHLKLDDCKQTTGLKIEEVIAFWKSKQGVKDLNNTIVCQQILTEVTNLVKEHGEAMSGVFASLNSLKKANYKLALASGSNYSLIYAVLEKLKLKNYFSIIQSAEDLELGKPHPEIFLLTAKKLQVNPLNCLVFEDSLNGVIAAKAAKMKCIAVPDKESMNKPEFALADLKINSLDEFDVEQLQKTILFE
jgi:sugar-phosphatase